MYDFMIISYLIHKYALAWNTEVNNRNAILNKNTCCKIESSSFMTLTIALLSEEKALEKIKKKNNNKKNK